MDGEVLVGHGSSMKVPDKCSVFGDRIPSSSLRFVVPMLSVTMFPPLEDSLEK